MDRAYNSCYNLYIAFTPDLEKDKPEPYSFTTNNCSQHVGIIAFAGDVFSTGDLIPNTHVLMDKETYILYMLNQSMYMGF